MINEEMLNYVKTLTPQEFKNQILNKSFADKCLNSNQKLKLLKV